ncbi:MAG: hypothetical protein IKK47_07570 [Ruminococcus sp.]|nr:hypothetical protein [Ruminococcus sp.]
MKRILTAMLAGTMLFSTISCKNNNIDNSDNDNTTDISLTKEEKIIYNALNESERYSYEEYGEIAACSNIYTYEYPHNESDELYPFILLNMSDRVDSYCYIDFSNDDEDVHVLVTKGKIKGSLITYPEMAVVNRLCYYDESLDDSSYEVDHVVELFTYLGFPPFYISDDSTINVKAISKKLKESK